MALLAACTTPPDADDSATHPERSSGWTDKTGRLTRQFAVAAAHPLAAQAGYDMLKAGGSAVDAAVAVQMVLSLVEPQSSGIGGGAFLVHYDGRRVEAYDGRETAPAKANERLFLAPDGKPLPFRQAIIGGRAVGVPGAVVMLEAAHREHGRLPWARLFEPAIALAEAGFAISPRLHQILAGDADLAKDPVAAAYLYDPAGRPWPIGHLLRNPELAQVLRRIATQGSDALMRGDTARAIVDKVRSHPTNAGSMELGDLAGYRYRKREPICFDHAVMRREYRICGMPPPGSGTIAIGQLLGVLGHTAADSFPVQSGLPDPRWLHLYMEASRLAFADRAKFVADPDFVQAPGGAWSSLLDPRYLAMRATRIGTSRMPAAAAGEPGATTSSYAPMAAQEEHGTSHISIVDQQGNAVAMTTTIENAWGAHLMVNRGVGLPGGFMLNNQLSDFSFLPADAQGRPVANRVQPGKRPRSAMAPTLVFDKASGRFLMSLGSPGGAMIIHYTAKALYAQLHWGMDTQRAIALPNFGTLGESAVLLEQGRFPEKTVAALREHGHPVREEALTSGTQGIARTPDGLFGGADPRREGAVAGQ